MDDRDALERSTRIEAIALVRAGRHRRRRRRGAPRVRAAPRARSRSARSSHAAALGVRRVEMAQADVLRPAPILVVGGAVGAASWRSSARPSSRSARRVAPIPTRRSTSRAPIVRARRWSPCSWSPSGPCSSPRCSGRRGTAGTTAPSRRAGAAGWWSGSPRPAPRPGRWRVCAWRSPLRDGRVGRPARRSSRSPPASRSSSAS